ncbi:DUF5606 family protein [Flavihumibacter petaseus]|uniref:Uncharacterized protein n=1 Tax=Flavihumibacter petaseus NBRC 106054 TaxID=1220578 RepID=A0A0E9MYN3_9BACT|nr:DUF5606 domain-containing protein [Flavihumibacter petaseus]GAO42235.1 hypothetical protein FPE01S_01_12480 [Flavihumibacter petaseus NBRC 106054]
MEYNRIIAVTGLPGLFELLSSKTDGAIVRSLDDNNTRFVSSRIHNFSHLESIEIYTVRDNVNLVDVFQAMEKTAEAAPDAKDTSAVKGFFQKVYPDMDFERVYTSDMKKMLKWFDVLKKNNIEIKLTEAPAEAEVAEATPEAEAPAAKAPKAKTKAAAESAATEETKPEKKAAPKAAATKKVAAEGDGTENADKPKKTARKKKTEEE